ncbi:MAG: thiol reductant ABC exporter subunit CydC [Rubrobacter sp.]
MSLLSILKLLSERGVRWQVAFGVLFACVAAGASVGLVALAGWFIAASALAGIAGAATFIVAYPSSGIRAFAVVRVVFRYLERLTNHRVTFSLLSRLRVRFFERALGIPSEKFGRYRSGDLLSRATSDVDALDNVFPRVVVPSVAAIAVGVGSVAFVAWFSPLLALILGAGCLVAGAALPLVSALAGRGSGTGITTAKAKLRMEMVEAVEGLPEVRSYGAGRIVATRLEAALDGLMPDDRRAKLADAAGTSLGGLVAQMTTLAVLVVGLALYQTVGLAGPVVALAVLLATGVFEQLGALPAAYRALGVSRAALERLSEIFGGGEEASDRTERLPETEGSAGLPVSVSGVSFGYEGRGRIALREASFEAEAGSVTVLVGPSGSGKTTLLRLISGELEPGSGVIELAGTPVGEIALDELPQRVAYAAQDEHIFDATLRENLTLAAPEAEDEVLIYVLGVVGLAEFYKGLRDGLDTPLGAHGWEVSGGQSRRLSVARAVLRRPGLLLLDEPTGSLDDETARHMLSSIRENMPRTTIILATHDPGLVRSVVPDVRVVEVG